MFQRLKTMIKDFLSGGGHSMPRSSFDAATFRFPPINADEVATKLRLREDGKRNGEDGLPHSASTVLDGPQQKVVQFVKGEAAELTGQFRTAIAGLNRKIAERDVGARIDQAKNIDQGFSRDLLDVKDDQLAVLEKAQAAQMDVERDFESFRKENGLKRLPRYPDPKTAVRGAAAVVFLVQCVVNTYFFQSGSGQGFLGRVFYSARGCVCRHSCGFLFG